MDKRETDLMRRLIEALDDYHCSHEDHGASDGCWCSDLIDEARSYMIEAGGKP